MKDQEKALKYLYRLISQRDYLENTLINKLYQKGYSSKVIDYAVSRIKELGYIDDERFIENYIKSSIKKLYGPNKIRNKLFMLKAPSSITEEKLSQLYTKEKIIENLTVLKSKNKKERDKFIAYCSRKGYSLNDIFEVINMEN